MTSVGFVDFHHFLFTNSEFEVTHLLLQHLFKVSKFGVIFFRLDIYQAVALLHQLLNLSAIHILPNIKEVDKHGR